MSKYFGFDFRGASRLSVALAQGLKTYAFECAPGGAVTSVHLRIKDNSVISVRSMQTTLNAGEWEEVDTLQFKHLQVSEKVRPELPLSSDWLEIARVEKIIFESDAFSAESGISLSNQVGGEFVISAAAFPGALAVRAPFVNLEFQPQYDLGSCRREALNI